MTLSCSKKISSLLREITSKNKGDFYCVNCLYSFRTKNKLESHKKYVEIKIFVVSSEANKILEFNQYLKSDKAPFIIYADLESLIEKIGACKNNPEKSSTAKANEDILSGFSTSTISPLKDIENKHDIYRGKDCIKKICESLREHAMKIINFKKKEMKLLTNEERQ